MLPCSIVRGINGSMLNNRSVPANVILPHITYQNVADALAWLKRTFGFTEHYRYGESNERVEGAQMRLGDAWIMLNTARPGRASPAQLGSQTQSLTVFVVNVDAHFEHAKIRRRQDRGGSARDGL